MIFKNAYLHNVSQLEEYDGGYFMMRVPDYVDKGFTHKNGQGKKMNRKNPGVEIRFVIKDENPVRIKIKTFLEGSCTFATVYYGSMQAGYTDSIKVITDEASWITINPTWNKELVEKIHKENSLPFDSRVVRVILNGANVIYDIEGNIEPPTDDMMPKKTIFFYGSSITFGSADLIGTTPQSFQVAQKLNCDYINMGFAGSCIAEKELADYIANDAKWDVAFFEMGVNAWGMDEVYRKNATYLLNEVCSKNPDKPVIVTDVYKNNADYFGEDIMDNIRKVVKDVVSSMDYKNLHYIDATEISDNFDGFGLDMLHPFIRGHERIAEKIAIKIKKYI